MEIFAGAVLLIAGIAYIDATWIRINDYYKIGAILSFFIQTSDMISDCFFVAQINIINKIELEFWSMLTLYLSILFIFSLHS